MRTVVLSGAALKDLKEAVEFIAADDPDAAARMSARLRAAAAGLAEFPALGTPLGDSGRRALTVARTPFRLVYRASRSRVTILRIWHGARGWPPVSS